MGSVEVVGEKGGGGGLYDIFVKQNKMFVNRRHFMNLLWCTQNKNLKLKQMLLSIVKIVFSCQTTNSGLVYLYPLI